MEPLLPTKLRDWPQKVVASALKDSLLRFVYNYQSGMPVAVGVLRGIEPCVGPKIDELVIDIKTKVEENVASFEAIKEELNLHRQEEATSGAREARREGEASVGAVARTIEQTAVQRDNIARSKDNALFSKQ